MLTARNSCDSIVDAFVAAVNSAPREMLPKEDLPVPCLLCAEPPTDEFDWQIVKSPGAGWLTDVEGRLPFRIPPTFRSLIARYVFPRFRSGPLSFYGIGLPHPDSNGDEFRFAIFSDNTIGPFLMKQGLLPFARPADGSYDPVCFDWRGSKRRLEPTVVRVDHEEMLCNDRLRVVSQVAAGFDVLPERRTKELRANDSENI
jgi:hypothetical protein